MMRRFASRQVYTTVLLPCAIAARHATTKAAEAAADSQKQPASHQEKLRQRVDQKLSVIARQNSVVSITVGTVVLAAMLYLAYESTFFTGGSAEDILKWQPKK